MDPGALVVAGRLYCPAFPAPSRSGAVTGRRLVTCGDRAGSGKTTRVDRAVLCVAAGKP
jgi:hypothetical protein